MKNILILLMIFLLIREMSYGQDYTFKTKITFSPKPAPAPSPCMDDNCSIKLLYNREDGWGEWHIFSNSFPVRNGVFSDSITVPATRTFRYLLIDVFHYQLYSPPPPFSPYCGSGGGLSIPYSLFSYNPNNCFYKKDSYTYKSGVDMITATVEVWIYPEKIPTIYRTGQDTNLLPTHRDDNININASIINYLPNFYNWEYRTNIDPTWKPIPGKAGKTFFTLNAVDIWGADAENHIDTNVFIRLNMGCERTSNILTFKVALSSPHIVNVDPISPLCYEEKNGAFKIQFDRALKPSESLSIMVNGSGPKVSLDVSNTYTWPRDLFAGNYTIELNGTYQDASKSTYTGGITHTKSLNIKEVDPIYVSIDSSNVRCFGGSDGAIKITATGGNKIYPYLFSYKKHWQTNFTPWQYFGGFNTHTLINLDTGRYMIRVKDINDCFEKDITNKEIARTITIIQPKEPITIDNSDTIPPRGAGLKDGKIMVYIKGGTPNTGGTYNIIWKDNAGTILSTGIVDTSLGAIYKTELQNIGKGKYNLTIVDANACRLDTSFIITEPPPITSTITQKHIVSCNSSNDGILQVQAAGGVPFKSGYPYKYEWYKLDSGNYISINQTDTIANNLPAGNYAVKITDANNISKYSPTFTLTEPAVIHAQFNTIPITCVNKGSITATLTGGTAPYHMEWTTGDTIPTITNLTQQGYYLIYMQDSRGCEGKDQIFLSSPNTIKIDTSIIKHPIYHNNNNGSIQLTISGGNPPYTYSWSNGATTKDLQNIAAGTYYVTITDASGCTQTQNYTLQNPPRIINTGGSPLPNGITTKTLCNGQRLAIDATINDNAATYRWNSNNGFSANTAQVTLTNIGKYWITVTDSRGVNASDTLIIKQSNANIDASFVVSTQAFKGEKVTFVNISYPAPERINWIIPNNPKIETIQNNQNVAELIFKDTGTYTISMKAFVGECEKMITKKVIVIEGQQFDDIGAVQNPYVKEFTIALNPNTGQFNVIIKLQEQGKIRLRMMNTSNSAMVDNRELSGSSQYTIPYTINAAAGVYILLLETAKGNQMQKIIIN